MKNTTILFLLLFPTLLFSQTVTESLASLKKTYKPLFSNEASILNMAFVRSFELGSSDTMYNFIIKVLTSVTSVESFSLGATILSLDFLSAGSYSIDYNIKKDKGEIVMDKKMFDEFYNCAKKIHSHLTNLDAYKKTNLSTLMSCGVENINLVGEYNPKGTLETKVKFYFGIGDAVFQMTKPEFENIMKTARKAKKRWLKVPPSKL